MSFTFVQDGQLHRAMAAPAGAVALASRPPFLLPPLVTDLHRGLQAWSTAGLSPAPLRADRILIGPAGPPIFEFSGDRAPAPLLQVGQAPDLAAWLVLLDQVMETFVVIARARAVWSVAELAGALGFLNPAYLRQYLDGAVPATWERVALALATAVADGPLPAAPQDRHWRAAAP